MVTAVLSRVISVVIGYVFGLFQTAYILGRMQGIDIRQHGSGNLGTTNMLRTKGLKMGLLTLALDMLKCVIAVFVTRAIAGAVLDASAELTTVLSVYTAMGVILGHDFPFYLGFKGGKGIAATAGFILVMSIIFWPMYAPLELLIFGVVFATTHYVSLGSLLLYIGFLAETVIAGQMELAIVKLQQNQLYEIYIIMTLLMVLAFYLHRENIGRLVRGEERKTYLKKKSEM